MKRLILTAAVMVFTAVSATAGPIRDRLAARFSRPVTCGQCQPPAAPVQYAPGPARQAVGTVLVATGGAVSEVGQAVAGDGYTPIRLASPLPTRPMCVGGTCR